METQQVPTGFEESHAEWLRAGGNVFRNLHRLGPKPEFYRSEYWKLVRESVLVLQKFQCCRCNGEANQVHHLSYNYVGEDHFHPETLVAICRPCHGLVEYARKAESLISRLERRISLCQGFIDDTRGCLDQTPVHVYARLLECRDELIELRRRFEAEIPHDNPRRSRAEVKVFMEQLRTRQATYKQQSEGLISTWDGSEKDKAKRLLPLLDEEIKNCREFIVEAFAPVPSVH